MQKVQKKPASGAFRGRFRGKMGILMLLFILIRGNYPTEKAL